MEYIKDLMIKSVKNKGFSLLEILQPYVSFNKVNTYDWYGKRVSWLEDNPYDAYGRQAAFLKTLEWGDKIPIEIIFQS